MKKVYADVIQFRNTHYDFGYMQGELIKDSILLKNRERQWLVRKPLFRIDKEETEQVFKKLAPNIWEEFIGLQDALKWPIERVLQEFGGYRVNINPSGCSIYVGDDYMIRNYDYHPKTYDGRFVLFQPTDGGFSKLYGSWAGTIHTTAYFPKDLEAWIVLGGDQEPAKFSFSSWLKGEDLSLKTIEGDIDTDIPFAHMERADWFK
ncbi:C45 family peptidase [Virgibacillus sp. 6R]|uniref:C45 family autoproteolytic acyltransferase/hydolase n=1 Tax=Metabacillus sp. 22489 TaxID=3453928 RepID=UPI0011AAD0BF